MTANELNAIVAKFEPLILGPEAKNPKHALAALAREIERAERHRWFERMNRFVSEMDSTSPYVAPYREAKPDA